MPDLRQEIAAANKKLMDAVMRGDSAAVAACYTAGGRALPPNAAPVEGAEPLREFWKSLVSLGIKSLELETVEAEAAGPDSAWEQGRYTLRGQGGIMDVGKYIVIWKREGGQWKLHRDIWNSSQPPQQSQ